MNDIAHILGVVIGWADEIGSYALALVAVGALSMAILEALKGLLKIRESFHERMLKRWLTKELIDAVADSHSDKESEDGSYVGSGACEIISLATGKSSEKIVPNAAPFMLFKIDSERALYTLPLENMMGQIQDATEIVLENPTLYESAFKLLTVGVGKEDVESWKKFSDYKFDTKGNSRDVAKIGSRIQQSIQRQLDTFQLKTNYIWARWNQIISYGIGTSILFLAIYSSREFVNDVQFWKEIPDIIVLSIFGGFTAPVAKDLYTNLQKVKVRG